MIRVEILDKNGASVYIEDGAITIEECSTYEVHLDDAVVRPNVRLGLLDLDWNASLGAFEFHSSFWGSAQQKLVIQGEEDGLTLDVRSIPKQDKVSEASWMAMVRDLENWLPGLTAGHEGGLHGGIGACGVYAPLLEQMLSPLLARFERILRSIIEEPHRCVEEQWQDKPITQVRRADREAMSWIVRHPHIGAWLHPWRSLVLDPPEPTIPRRVAQESNDHPINRYLSWLSCRVVDHARRIADKLEKLSTKTDTASDGYLWCKVRADILRKRATRVERIWRYSFLRRLKPEPPSQLALAVIVDHPTYSRAHQVAYTFLSPRFSLDSKDDSEQGAVKPSFDLFELWTFFRLLMEFRSLKGETWRWDYSTLNELVATGSTGDGIRVLGHGEAQKIEISFNPKFVSYFGRKGGISRWSITGERRPDLVVALSGGENRPNWLVLDAKYRIGRRHLSDAFTSVHVYRDSLRYNGYGGSPAAAFLLAPASSDDTRDWFRKSFIEEYRAGAIELGPNSENESKLAVLCINLLERHDQAQDNLPNRRSHQE